MLREPAWASSIRWLSDKFHETNHSTCSCTFRSTKHPKAIEWNTSGAEQINSRMQRKAKSFRCMNLKNAVNAMAIFTSLLNANSTDIALKCIECNTNKKRKI
jgi:hypothetical protein